MFGIRPISRASSLLVVGFVSLGFGQLQDRLPVELEGIRITEKLGASVDLGLQFTAENGRQVPLSSFFKSGKPVILDLVYYRCPMLCNLVLNGQVAALRDIPWTPGKEFEVVTISIDPMEDWGLAARKKQFYMEALGKPVHEGWHFLTDHQGNVKKLAEQVGFAYRWDDNTQQFAHAGAIMVLTPDGRMSRYLYGVKYKSRDVRLALSEASEGKLGSFADKVLMFCFHYDPLARSYVPFARNLMKAAGILTILIFGGILMLLWTKDRTRPLPDELVTVK